MKDLSIVIPFYNESFNSPVIIDKLTRNLDKSKWDYEIIAVNNGSTDNTGEILDDISDKNGKIRIVTVEENLGYGYGIRKGLELAEGNLISYIWADDFVGAETLLDLASNLDKSESSLAKITRVVRKDGLFRKTQSVAYNSLFRLVFGINSKDINGCPKIMKRDFYESVKLKSNDWFLDPEIMIALKDSNRTFLEVSRDFEKREFGKSNVRLYTCFEFLKNMFVYKFRKKIFK
tara:strand:+ start:942 stop:1640 length:699 start_codon:yes stop_codon:yes gene_type:complete